MSEPLLSIRDLDVDFLTPRGAVRGVDKLSLDVARGEILGIAGESGSGKSTLAQAILRVLPPPAVIRGGQVLFEGRDLLKASEAELRDVRWKRISIVLQSSLDALNPVLDVRAQILDTLLAHGAPGADALPRAEERARSLLKMVEIPVERLRSYPHELSGGMRQRVAIALALALDPALVILDEPTTALDVVVERDILAMLMELRTRRGFSIMLITHDLGRMMQVCDRVAILYAARLVELGPVASLHARPLHPYTQGLLRAFPTLDDADGPSVSIAGAPPSLESPPPGCRFHPRCPHAEGRCRTEAPRLSVVEEDRRVACHLLER
jgi:peptide/nickel transport system ATP-binding protein